MNLQDSIFVEDVEHDITLFSKNKTRRRVLVFPPVNNYRRFLIHQLVQDRFSDLLHTFSIGQGIVRRTVVCYKTDVIRDTKLDGAWSKTRTVDTMGIEGQSSPSTTPEHNNRQRQVKSVPTVEIYRPPAARRASRGEVPVSEQLEHLPTDTSIKSSRQRRPDRAVYIPRHRRGAAESETEGSPANVRERVSVVSHTKSSPSTLVTSENSKTPTRESGGKNQRKLKEHNSSDHNFESKFKRKGYNVSEDSQQLKLIVETAALPEGVEELEVESKDKCSTDMDMQEEMVEVKDAKNDEVIKKVMEVKNEGEIKNEVEIETEIVLNNEAETKNEIEIEKEVKTNTEMEVKNEVEMGNKVETKNERNREADTTPNLPQIEEKPKRQNIVTDVLIISDRYSEKKHEESAKSAPVISMTPPEKKVKKVERHKSKPASPPSPPFKINRDECDWDSLFDDNGDCLDPTLIEELTSAVGEVMIEQPKNDYKAYTKPVEVSQDEFAHVIEIYNFPSEFKTSDLAAVFSPFKNGGFELKWVDDTHCLGVFSSPLIAAEVLASDHPFVKTRPLSEATALSKTKARRSSEFLQPYRSRPETCAALARRLVTGALGVKLATARQEREHEKIVLREAKERRRLANKQREDAWEGIITQK